MSATVQVKDALRISSMRHHLEGMKSDGFKTLGEPRRPNDCPIACYLKRRFNDPHIMVGSCYIEKLDHWYMRTPEWVGILVERIDGLPDGPVPIDTTLELLDQVERELTQ